MISKKGTIFMYTSVTSAKVTRVITVLFCVLLSVLMVFGPKLLQLYFGYLADALIKKVLLAFYLCCPAAWAALISILRLMTNIIRGEIFTPQTVFSMRLLSWCCAYVSLVCLIFGFFWAPLLVFALGAAFMTLILRVLKSVMARASELRAENDLTI